MLCFDSAEGNDLGEGAYSNQDKTSSNNHELELTSRRQRSVKLVEGAERTVSAPMLVTRWP